MLNASDVGKEGLENSAVQVLGDQTLSIHPGLGKLRYCQSKMVVQTGIYPTLAHQKTSALQAGELETFF